MDDPLKSSEKMVVPAPVSAPRSGSMGAVADALVRSKVEAPIRMRATMTVRTVPRVLIPSSLVRQKTPEDGLHRCLRLRDRRLRHPAPTRRLAPGGRRRARGARVAATCWRPRRDSNARTRLRRPMLYPLSYEGRRTNTSGTPHQRSHGLGTLERSADTPRETIHRMTAIPFSLLPDHATVGDRGQLVVGGCDVLDLARELGTP